MTNLKCFRLFFLLFLIFSSLPCNAAAILVKERVPQKNRYVLYIKAYDWGAAGEKAVLNIGKKVAPEVVHPEDFEVTRVLMPSDITNSLFGISKGERKVVRAFVSDEKGNEVFSESRYITLEFEISPEAENQNPFVTNIFLTGSFNNFFGLKFENEALDFRITRLEALVCPEAARFGFGIMNDEEVSVKYAYYENEYRNRSLNESSALILWMHGIAEGGQNPYIPLLGTKAVNLSENFIQKYFSGGADLIVPQCPTGWLETTTKDVFGLRMWAPVDIEGTVNNAAKSVGEYLGMDVSVNGAAGGADVNYGSGASGGAGVASGSSGRKVKGRDENYIPPASVSYYSNVIRKIIDDYLEKHPYIDRNRIYIGGCSAGGYMTVNMVLQNPELFAAAFTACEAYPDSKITEKQLSVLSGIPFWFTHSENDRTIKPKNHDADTVRRLRAIGAKDLHFTMYPDVRDLSGTWKNPDGSPFQFDNHASWIYVLNNSPEENGVSLFEWLGKKRK